MHPRCLKSSSLKHHLHQLLIFVGGGGERYRNIGIRKYKLG
jgi:hypothetical protein